MQMAHQGPACGTIAAVCDARPAQSAARFAATPSPWATVLYDAAAAGRQARQRLRATRRPRKLQNTLSSLTVVTDLLRQAGRPTDPRQMDAVVESRYGLNIDSVVIWCLRPPCVFLMHVHLVFVTRYRREVFTQEILDDLHGIFASVCADFEAELAEFDGEGHVHLLVNYSARPPWRW